MPMGLHRRPRQLVDAGLVPRPLGAEPGEDIRIQAQRHLVFGKDLGQPPAQRCSGELLGRWLWDGGVVDTPFREVATVLPVSL